MDTRASVLSELQDIVREVAGWHIARGKTNSLLLAANALGINPRRAQAFHWGEVRMVTAWEAERMRSRHTALLSERVERVERDLQQLRERLSRSGATP